MAHLGARFQERTYREETGNEVEGLERSWKQTGKEGQKRKQDGNKVRSGRSGVETKNALFG